MKKNYILILSVFLIAILAIVTRLLLQDIGSMHKNYDISTHMELTGQALHRVPASEHSFLPLVSLDHTQTCIQDGDESYSLGWGITQLNRNKTAFIYTSFTSPSFMLPYLAHIVFEFDNYQYSILLASLLCYLLSLILILYLFHRVYYLCHQCSPPNLMVICLALIVSFTPETIISLGGLNYWAQSLAFPVQLATMIALTYVDWKGKFKLKAILFVIALSICCALTEWSGFCGIAALAGFFLLLSRFSCGFNYSKKLSFVFFLLLCSAFLASFAIIVVHFFTQLGIQQILFTSASRASSRSAFSIDVSCEYVKTFFNSYSWFAYLLIIIFVVYLKTFCKNLKLSLGVCATFIFAVGMLLENVVLMQHAARYSYDQLKWLALAPFVLTSLPVASKKLYSYMQKSLVFLCIIFSLFSVKKEWVSREEWHESLSLLFDENQRVVDEAFSNLGVERSEVIVGINSWSGGYFRLLFSDIPVLEWTNIDELAIYREKYNKKIAVFFKARFSYPDTVRLLEYKILKADDDESASLTPTTEL